MLVIHPDECIDCGVCEPECPAEAITPDAGPSLGVWLKLNAEFTAEPTQKKGAAAGRGCPQRFPEQVRAISSRPGQVRVIEAEKRSPSQVVGVTARVCSAE